MKSGRALLEHGFSLIELVVVLGILGLIGTLLPQGLNRLYNQVSVDSIAHQLAAELRQCARTAQQHKRHLMVGNQESGGCRVSDSEQYQIEFEAGVPTTFHSDGTSNGHGLVVMGASNLRTVQVNRLTSQVSVIADAN